MRVWGLRVVWLTLPITAGAAAADAVSTWADAPKIVGGILCWLAWTVGTVAVLAPRPAALTALRAVAPACALAAGFAAVTGTVTGLDAWAGVAATLVAAALSADHEIARLAANAVAYGDERRYPLRTPPALFLGPLPVVRLVVVGGVAAGPLLIADGRYVVGALAVVVGAAAVPLGIRALHSLSRRWIVLVPAGVVVADPLTLADPTLFLREHVRALRAVDATPDATPDAPPTLDLRLGASRGSVLITLDEAVDLVRAGRGRRGGTTASTSGMVVAVDQRRSLLEAASTRRVRVELRGGPDQD